MDAVGVGELLPAPHHQREVLEGQGAGRRLGSGSLTSHHPHQVGLEAAQLALGTTQALGQPGIGQPRQRTRQPGDLHRQHSISTPTTIHVPSVPTGCATVRWMDLRRWVTDEHTTVLDRLRGGVLRLVPANRWRERVDGGGSSIAWLLLHLAHHQDLALSTAIRDHAPLLASRRDRLGLTGLPAWVGLPETEDPAVTAAVDLDELQHYVFDVHDATSAWLDAVPMSTLDTVADASRRLAEVAGIPTDELAWLHSMWDGRTVGWLVQWECIGHGITHVGEMVAVRNRMGLSPF